jgi:hypothetical protein
MVPIAWERSFESWLAMAHTYGSNDIIFAYERGQVWILPTIKKKHLGRHSFIRVITSFYLGQLFLRKINSFGLNRLPKSAKRFTFSHFPKWCIAGFIICACTRPLQMRSGA